MPPNSQDTCSGVLNETDCETSDGGLRRDIKAMAQLSDRKYQIIPYNVFVFVVAHSLALYGIVLVLLGQARWQTLIFTPLMFALSTLGITAGVHRLWAHRSYKANLPLRALLLLFATISHQNSVIHWAREHRVHHKFSETNADPVNATRGFFYSHIGWMMVKKHPDVAAKGATVDISDLLADPMLTFQRRHYKLCTLIVSYAVPFLLPVLGWGETALVSLCVPVMLRWVCSLNVIWMVNSLAHMIGRRPYDANMKPSQNVLVDVVTLGEGSHNYHHVFPWDYKSSEFGNPLNFTKMFIDAFARIGWAYDLKSVSKEMVAQRMRRTGDGSANLWGWGDREQDPAEMAMAEVTAKRVR